MKNLEETLSSKDLNPIDKISKTPGRKPSKRVKSKLNKKYNKKAEQLLAEIDSQKSSSLFIKSPENVLLRHIYMLTTSARDHVSQEQVVPESPRIKLKIPPKCSINQIII